MRHVVMYSNIIILQHSSDRSLTVERVTPIFMNVRYWAKIGPYIIIPDARVAVIREQSQYFEQQEQAAFYYVNCYDGASWSDLAMMLHRAKESAAIQTFILQLPKPKGDQSVLCLWHVAVHCDAQC